MKKNKEKTPRKSNIHKLRKLIGHVKKDASVFLSSEEGKIVKKDIVKTAIAMGLIAGAANNAFAGHGDVATPHTDLPHADFVTQQLINNPPGSTGYHSSLHVNGAHNDNGCPCHSDHGNGGWC